MCNYWRNKCSTFYVDFYAWLGNSVCNVLLFGISLKIVTKRGRKER
jgi:hypothetical protein